MSEQTQRPERLFRYFSPGLSHIFSERKLWFAAASDFNDIFEVYPRYDKLVPQIVDEVLKRKFAFSPPNVSYDQFKKNTKALRLKLAEDGIEQHPDIFQAKFSTYYGIVCFSERLDSLLMWGHYTGCHRGFAVEFDPGHSIFSPRDFGKVIYELNRPVLTMEADSQMLLRKSPEWAYEREWRLIKPRSELMNGSFMRNEVATPGHFVPLPMEAIKAVYFGCKISPDIRNMLLKPLEAFPQINRFFMRRHRIEYKLETISWNEWNEPTDPSTILSLPWKKTAE